MDLEALEQRLQYRFVSPPLLEQGLVTGQGIPGGLYVRGCLLQGQWQPAQHFGQI